MGCVQGSLSAAEKEAIKKNKLIEEQLKKDRRTFEDEVKILLLGAGESGKSTIAKQMRIIHLSGFSTEEKKTYIDIIHHNTITAMQNLLLGARELEIPIPDQSEELLGIKAKLSDVDLTPSIARLIKDLWKDPGVLQAYENRSEFQLIDSAKYFFDAVDRTSELEYIPTDDDILRVRAKTTGIVETTFNAGGLDVRMVDVGGQRNEREKWIHCFEEVTAIIYVCAMSGYDLVLEEDESVNRLHESLQLFEDVANSRWFNETPIILFLNKKDLFEEKVTKVDLSICFESYGGGLNYQNAVEYIEDEFMDRKSPKQKVFVHQTCATDTENVKVVFNAVKNIFLETDLKTAGISYT